MSADQNLIERVIFRAVSKMKIGRWATLRVPVSQEEFDAVNRTKASAAAFMEALERYRATSGRLDLDSVELAVSHER